MGTSPGIGPLLNTRENLQPGRAGAEGTSPRLEEQGGQLREANGWGGEGMGAVVGGEGNVGHLETPTGPNTRSMIFITRLVCFFVAIVSTFIQLCCCL